MRVGRPALRNPLTVVAVYVVVAAWRTWPLVWQPTMLVNPEGGPTADLLLILWILGWDTHALMTAPASIFDANIFHPARYMLSGSEHLFASVPLFAPVWLATGNAIVALNVVTLTTFVLSGVFMHLLVREWTGCTVPAYVAGVAFACAPWRMLSLHVIPHALASQYLPLVLLGLERTLRTASPWSAVLLATALTLQALSSYYLAYMAFALVAVWCLVALVIVGVRGRVRGWVLTAIALGASTAIVVAVSWPYAAVKSYGRLDVGDAPAIAEMFRVAGRPDHIVLTHVGWAPAALAAPALILVWLVRRGRLEMLRIMSLVGVTVLALLFAQGAREPTGLYAIAARIVPGFENVRIPTRFGALASFGLCALAGLSVALVLKMVGDRRRLAIAVRAAAIGVLVAGLATSVGPSPELRAWTLPTAAEIPGAYRWLGEHGEGGPLLEVPEPLSLTIDRPMRMYLGMFHWLPMVSGYSGYEPPSYRFLLPYLAQLPTEQSFDLIARCTGIRWVLVHGGGSRRPRWDTLSAVRPVGLFPDEAEGADTLYEVVAPHAGSCATVLASGPRQHEHETADGNVLGAHEAIGQAAIEGLPPALVAGGESLVTVTIANRGSVVVPSTSIAAGQRFEVLASWARQASVAVTPAAAVAIPIPMDIPVGDVVRFDAWIAHPRVPGSYDLRVVVGARSRTPDGGAFPWSQSVRVLAPGQ